jgi:hypothetical protein
VIFPKRWVVHDETIGSFGEGEEQVKVRATAGFEVKRSMETE